MLKGKNGDKLFCLSIYSIQYESAGLSRLSRKIEIKTKPNTSARIRSCVYVCVFN